MTKAYVRFDTQFSQEEYKELLEEVDKLGLNWNKCILIWMRAWKEGNNKKNGKKV